MADVPPKRMALAGVGDRGDPKSSGGVRELSAAVDGARNADEDCSDRPRVAEQGGDRNGSEVSGGCEGGAGGVDGEGESRRVGGDAAISTRREQREYSRFLWRRRWWRRWWCWGCGLEATLRAVTSGVGGGTETTASKSVEVISVPVTVVPASRGTGPMKSRPDSVAVAVAAVVHGVVMVVGAVAAEGIETSGTGAPEVRMGVPAALATSLGWMMLLGQEAVRRRGRGMPGHSTGPDSDEGSLCLASRGIGCSLTGDQAGDEGVETIGGC